jgi:hypothetical protein
MIRALAMKEMRETAWVWLIAAGWFGFMAADVMQVPLLPGFVSDRLFAPTRGDGREIPFVGNGIASSVALGMGVLGVALGIRQTVGEMWTGTYPLTLHLPMLRSRLFAVKFAVGVAVVWVLGGLALGALCIWAATPGTHPSPFEWNMTSHAWRTWFAMPIVYFGAAATGLFAARWYGMRLLPLVSACTIAWVIVVLSSLEAASPIMFVGAAAGAMIVYVIVLSRLIAVRDFS